MSAKKKTKPAAKAAKKKPAPKAKDKPAARKLAESTLARHRANPNDFAKLARELSKDTGSAANGGDLGFFGRGMMVKPFEEAAFKLKAGQLSDIVETDFGYHIIRVTEIKGAQVKPFDEVKAQIRAELQRERAANRPEARKLLPCAQRRLAEGVLPHPLLGQPLEVDLGLDELRLVGEAGRFGQQVASLADQRVAVPG